MLQLQRPRRLTSSAALVVSALLLTAASATAAEKITSEQRDFFETRIRPVLVKHCYECHSHEAGTPAADYALDSRDGLRAGGATGEPAVIPGKPESSPFFIALTHSDDELQMPPEEKLPGRVIADFRRWIVMGAPDPRTDDAQQRRQREQQASAGKLWSLQQPVEPELPAVKDADWPRSPIDRFVLARLEQKSLAPVGDAAPEKLMRRIYFDLTGLPPNPESVEQFVSDPTPAAFEQVVDRLLQSPQFGERWGRHWLDLARYAESSGMEFNFTYPHAWPYRDYVIDSLNEDKPYDRFITEQLAGDLLPADSDRQRDENRLATGFLAVGPKRHNARTTDFRMEIVDDQIRATSEALLGLTVGCARCHDHKFDPVPTEDYYALAGIFLSTKTLHGTEKIKYSRHPSGLVAFGPNARERHKKYEAHQKKLEDTQKQLSDKEEKLKKLKEARKKEARKKEARKKDGEKNHDDKKDDDKKDDDKKKGDKEKGETKKEDGKQADGKIRSLEKEIQSLKETIKQLKNNTPEAPQYGMGVTEGKPADTHVAIGGDPGSKGDVVPRGFLSAVAMDAADHVPEVTDKSSGRLKLARWVTSRDNPLTARVFVNRVWHHLFGRGLVPSVNNFGVLGERPSHPELLDYLAVRFMDEGWSVKKLIRSVVLSRAYQLSTHKDADGFRVDPDNTLVWRMTPRRLEVEPLRDAILAVSGQLDPARPAGSSVTALGQQLARRVAWSKLNPPSRHRTVYLPVVRHYASHMHQEFDFAASSLVVGDRAETTTSQQALFFLNNDFILKQSEAAAASLIDRHPNDAREHPNVSREQIRLAYRRTLCRQPTESELVGAVGFLQRARRALQKQYDHAEARHRIALASLVQTLFGSAEFRYLIHAPNTAESADSAQEVLTKAGSQ